MKSFHSEVLYGIVRPDCMFWNYEFEWVECLHDWAIFQVTKIGRTCIEDKF